jgi:hypothetical protein
MDSLENLAFRVHTQSLSVPEKQKLIRQLEEDIDNSYKIWCENMTKFLESKKLSSYKVHRNFKGYTLSHKRGVLTQDLWNDYIAYYIIDGKLGLTKWNDMGSPSTSVIEIQDIREEPLLFFVATHPETNSQFSKRVNF